MPNLGGLDIQPDRRRPDGVAPRARRPPGPRSTPPRSPSPHRPRSDPTRPARRLRSARRGARVRPVSAPFRFDRIWTFPVPPAELWAVLERTDDYVSWWSWLREFDADGLHAGQPGPVHHPVAVAVRAALRHPRARGGARGRRSRPRSAATCAARRGSTSRPSPDGFDGAAELVARARQPGAGPPRPLRPAGDVVGPRRRGRDRRRPVPAPRARTAAATPSPPETGRLRPSGRDSRAGPVGAVSSSAPRSAGVTCVAQPSRPRNRRRTGVSRRGLRPPRGHAVSADRRSPPRTTTSAGAAPTRPGSNGTSRSRPPTAGSPRSTSATRRSCFGRLDRTDGTRSTSAGSAVDDAERTPLVVDWRAPVAEPFYRATALDADGRRCAAGTSSPGTGARSSGSTTRSSTPRPSTPTASRSWARARCSPRSSASAPAAWRDIVATIQAEQDEAVRADLPGRAHRRRRSRHRQDRGRAAPRRVPPLHVPAAAREPGRAARRAEPGVPPLHRAGAPVARRARGAARHRHRPQAAARPRCGPRTPAIAAVKGDVRMATVLRRALADRERPPRQDVEFRIDGLRLRLSRRECRRIARAVQRRKRGTHNERRPLVERMLLDRLARAVPHRDDRAPQRELLELDDEDGGYDAQVARVARPRRARRRRSGSARCAVASGARPRCASCSSACGRCSPAPSSCTTCSASEALIRSRGRRRARPRGAAACSSGRGRRRVRDVAWTEADVALVDEADALLRPGRGGPAPVGAAPHRRPSARSPTRPRAPCASSASGST